MNAATRIDSSTLWDGNAGQITGKVGNLTLNDGAQIRSQSGGVAAASRQPSVGLGKGGSVTFTEGDSILITGSNSGVSTNTFGDGNAGNISLKRESGQCPEWWQCYLDKWWSTCGSTVRGLRKRRAKITVSTPDINNVLMAGGHYIRKDFRKRQCWQYIL